MNCTTKTQTCDSAIRQSADRLTQVTQDTMREVTEMVTNLTGTSARLSEQIGGLQREIHGAIDRTQDAIDRLGAVPLHDRGPQHLPLAYRLYGISDALYAVLAFGRGQPGKLADGAMVEGRAAAKRHVDLAKPA